ncbi:Ig-like domain-containing protein [Xenorhabdus budapestensis]|uniref:Ig-like domain-containing protein n=1 Tax=Xenorhabdus budapestensis TaxID=290110 RepID=UPI003A840DD9
MTVAVGSETVMTSPIRFITSLTHTLQADKQTAIADGQDSILYTVNVRGAADQPVANSKVQWSTDNGQLLDRQEQTNSQGEATARLVSRTAGMATVSAEVSGKMLNASPVTFKRLLKPAITVDKTRAATDGEDRVIFTVTVTDIHGQGLADKAVDWSGNLGEMIFAEGWTDSQGNATATFVSRHAGPALVTADVGEQPIVSSVEFIPPLRLVDTVAVDSEGGNANQKSFGIRGPFVFWHGAKFRIITAGNTGGVNWQSDSPSVTVSGNVVTVQQNPDGVRFTDTDETGQQVELTLTVHTWFERSGLTEDFYSNANQICQSLGSRIASKYALEQLCKEWGNFYLYDGWVREFYVTSTDYLAARSGSAEHQAKWVFWAETDRWTRNAWAMTGFACGKQQY